LGKFVVIFDREKGQWLSYNVKTKQTVPLNKDLSVSFVDEEFDMPDFPTHMELHHGRIMMNPSSSKTDMIFGSFFRTALKSPETSPTDSGVKTKLLLIRTI
jgi:hypothetical protein